MSLELVSSRNSTARRKSGIKIHCIPMYQQYNKTCENFLMWNFWKNVYTSEKIK